MSLFPIQQTPSTYFFDFDSTLYPKESLEELLALSLQNHPEKEQRQEQIKNIGEQGMNGLIDLKTSIAQRLKIADLHRKTIDFYLQNHSGIEQAVSQLLQKIHQQGHWLYLLSNGFLEWIIPMVKDLPFLPQRIIANRFCYDRDDKVIGFKPHALHAIDGKWQVIHALAQTQQTQGAVYMVGDSISDAQAKKSGGADYFIAWMLYVQRSNVEHFADFCVRETADLGV